MLITQFNFTAAVNCVSSINLRIRVVQVHSYSYICLFVYLFVFWGVLLSHQSECSAHDVKVHYVWS